MNNRNHPYFISITGTNPVVEKSKLNTEPPKPVVEYKPRMATPWSPRWINNQNFVENLATMKPDMDYNADIDGYRIDKMGYLFNAFDNSEASGGVIAAAAIASDVDDPNIVNASNTFIMNTEDYGLRHVIVKNGTVRDFGPVESTCIIGNVDHPEGVYIPMCNTRAMADGIMLVERLLESSIKDNADMPPVERLACPYYVPKDSEEE